MTEKVLHILTPMFGKACCRVRVGGYKSLSIGFGDKIYHNNPKLIDEYYGEWEIGTYYCAWRMVSGNKILCASSDTLNEIELLHNKATQIPIGSIVSISQISDIDVKVKTDSGVDIDFLATISKIDEYFHVETAAQFFEVSEFRLFGLFERKIGSYSWFFTGLRLFLASFGSFRRKRRRLSSAGCL